MARRGIFGKLIDRLTGRKPSRPSVPRPPGVSPPSGPAEPRKPAGFLKQRVVNHIVATSPLANRRRVSDHVDYMDIDELEWTLQANAAQIAWRARQDADRTLVTDEGAILPLNPWWYR